VRVCTSAWLQNDLSGEPARVRSWIGVIALILAVVMNESAIDSMQSGLTASFTSHFFKDQHVIFSRLIVMAINIPLMIIALQVSGAV
jgi:hypothetical protein